MQDMGVDGGLGKTEREVNNYEYQDKNHVGMDDTTHDKINSDAFARKDECITQQIQESNEDGVTHTHEPDSGTLVGEKNREEVNSPQVTTRIDKENFVDIGKRRSGRKHHVGMDDTTDKINSDAFARKDEYITQQIQDGNKYGVTHTHESDSGTLAGEKNREEVNSPQVTTRIDKENFVEIGKRRSGRKDHVGMDDTTNDKINSDAFARKHEFNTQLIQDRNKDRVTHTHESYTGTIVGEKNREEVNSPQVTTGIDKENSVEIGKTGSERKDTHQKKMNNAVQRIEARNPEIVLGKNALSTILNSSDELMIEFLI
jgi:hypothetical protein